MRTDSNPSARPYAACRSIGEAHPGGLGGVIPQDVTMPSQGTLPLMIPASPDTLVRMLTARYGQQQAQILAHDIENKGVEVPRRGTGELVATGFFVLKTDSQGHVSVGARGTQSPACDVPRSAWVTSGLVESAVAWLTQRQDVMPVVQDALRSVSGSDHEVTLETEYRNDHDRLMNLSAASVLDELEGKRPKLVFDTDVPAALDTEQHREGLTILFALGLVHQFCLLSGRSQQDALLNILTFHEGLGTGQEQLLAVLETRNPAGHKLIDNADDFARFLTKSAGAADSVKRHHAALLAKLERVERAYAHRQLARDLLDEAARPRLNELGLAGLREIAHRHISQTYSNAVEELAALRVAAEMQEGGVELVMGFLGRAGLVEQLLMAAAQVVPTAELREPFARIHRSFRAQRYTDLHTPELRQLEDRWQAAGAPLSRLATLVTDPRVSLPQLQGAIMEFEEALDAFCRDASTLVRTVARKNKDSITATEEQDRAAATGHGGEATGRYQLLHRDLAAIRETVDKFTGAALGELELRAGRLSSSRGVWNVEMQRLMPAETLNLYLLNELLDPFLGETSDFRNLLNSGGANLHVTSHLAPWLAHVSHWVQALPAYAWYEIVDLPGDNYEVLAGCQRDILEIAFKGNTEAIAANIEDVMHSEHVAIARGILATRMHLTPQIDTVAEALKKRGRDADGSREEAIRLMLQRKGLGETIEALATLVAASYRNLEEEVGRYAVSNRVERVTALAHVLRADRTPANLVAPFCEPLTDADANAEQTRAQALALVADPAFSLSGVHVEMRGRAFLRRRELPCFHNLTTLGPGETTTYLKTWLETALSLYLFCRDQNLEERVQQRIRQYRQRIGHAAWRVVQELGLQGELFEMLVREGGDPANEQELVNAAGRFAAQYPTVSIEVARICVISEYEEKNSDAASSNGHFNEEPVRVRECLSDANQRRRLEAEANAWAIREYDTQNNTELGRAVAALCRTRRWPAQTVLQRLIDPQNAAERRRAPWISEEGRQQLRAERDAYLVSLARKQVVAQLGLEGEVGRSGHIGAIVYNRLHAGPLAAYTARQEIVSEYLKTLRAEHPQNPAAKAALNNLLNQPRYRYEADGPYRKFGMLYTPSRVDLGEGERHSVEAVGKVVAANDQTTLNRGSALYDLFNLPGTIQFQATAMGEFFKARENFFTRGGVFYLSLGEGMNIDALLMGDQEMYMRFSNLRGDRIVLPTGMSYRGFCVPKEFFLIYAVLVAPTNREAAKRMLMAFAPSGENAVFERLIEGSFGEPTCTGAYTVRRDSFIGMLRQTLRLEAADASAWEQKAADFIAGGYRNFFGALTDAAFVERMDEALPALNAAVLASAPRIAKAFEGWGITMTEEELKTRQLLFSMAAWVNRKLHGLEQINRFGPYRTVKLMSDLVGEARQRCRAAGRRCKENDADLTMQMGGPYKAGTRTDKGENRPITDARLSAAADLTLILSGKDDQILRELDPEGRRVADQIRREAVVPGCIRIAGTVTAKDLIAARQEMPVGEYIDEGKARLARLGISEEQLACFCGNREWGERFWLWPIAEEAKQAIRADRELTRLLHLIALEQGGVITSYAEAVQGCDVHVATVGDPELLDLIDNLPEFVGRARRANPDGLFVLCDGQVGARPRAAAVRNIVAEYKIKELFALDDTAVYGCLGLGKADIRRWRGEMEKERSQAGRLHKALCAGAATGDYAAARAVYEELAADVRTQRKSERTSLILRAGGRETKKLHPFFDLLSLCLTNVKAGLPLERLDFATWLALGGRYLLNGHLSQGQYLAFRRSFEEAVARIPRPTPEAALPPTFLATDDDKAQAVFFRPQYEPHEDPEFGQKTGGGITVGKTEGETRAATIGRRRERDRKTRRQLMEKERRVATNALIAEQRCQPTDQRLGLDAAYDNALAAIGASRDLERPFDAIVGQRQFSGLLYWAQVAAFRAIDGVITDDAEPERLAEKRLMREHVATCLGSGISDPKAHKQLLGQDLTRLIELASEHLIGQGITRETMTNEHRDSFVGLAKVGELLDIALLLALEYDIDLAGLGQEPDAAVSGLFTFFDQTMNAHHFDYLPFYLQPGLSDGVLERWLTRAEKLQLACDRHRWLYGRVRKDIVERTPLADRPPEYHNVWLGNVSRWQHPETWQMGLGVNVDTESERFWFSYARLRDAVAMMRELVNLNNPSTLNGVPEIFLNVPPAVLDAGEGGKCANILSVYPYGNTTMLVAIEQGVALERDNLNLMACPFPELCREAHDDIPFLRARDALLYVSGERYEKLLVAAGAEAGSARERAASVPRQGVLVALTFTAPPDTPARAGSIRHGEPVAAHGVFFHFTHPLRGDIDHAAVELIQPIGAEALTYLKSAVPKILAGTRVATPVGLTWSMDDTRRAQDAAAEAPAQQLGRAPSAVEISGRIESQIRQRVWTMLQRYPFVTEVIAKPEKESGGRGAEVLPILSRTSRTEGLAKLYGSKKTRAKDIQEEVCAALEGARLADAPEGMRNLQRLARLIYETSKKDNVVVQGLVHSHVRMLFSHQFLEHLVERRARRGQCTSLDIDPQTRLFAYFRYILARGTDREFQHPQSSSHTICVISGEAVGNAARPGSTLDVYRDEIVNPEFREPLRRAMDIAFYEGMAARRSYLRKYWFSVLREYLTLNQHLAVTLQSNLASFLRDRCSAVVDEFMAIHGEWAVDRGQLERFLSNWVERLFGVDDQGRDFLTALAADYGDLAIPFAEFLGSHLEQGNQLALDIHYSMDDAMPMYLGDESRNYRYIVAHDEHGNIRLDEWGNMTLLPLADPHGLPTGVQLFDRNGHTLAMAGEDGRAAPVAIFESAGGECKERELYDRDVSRMSEQERDRFRVSCFQGMIIEFNPGAGLWRLYDLELQKLDPRRAGEGVLGVFRPLGERARRFKETGRLPRFSGVGPGFLAAAGGGTSYFGLGGALFAETPAARPRTLEGFVDGAASKARADMNKAGEYAFTADDLALVFSYGAAESIHVSCGENWVATQSLSRDQVARAVNEFLSERQLVRVVQRRLALAPGVEVAALVRGAAYREAIGSVVYECLQRGEEAVAVRIAAAPLDKRQTTALLGTWKTCGLIFEGSETLSAEMVAAFQLDADRHFGGGSGLNFLGVRGDWLTPDGSAATQALVVEDDGVVRQVAFATPVRLQAAGIFHLDTATEQTRHRELTALFGAAHVPVINPYGTTAATLDSKSRTHTICAGVVQQPVHELIDLGQHRDEASRKASLEVYVKNRLRERGVSVGGKKAVKVVVKPDHGTEGMLARSFRLQVADGRIVENDELAGVLQHLEAIGREGRDAIAEEERGNVTYDGGKRVVLRVNVCETPAGYRGDTGFARVAGKPSEVIVSQATEATTEDIKRVLLGLEWNGKALRGCMDPASLNAVLSDTVSQLKTSACRVAAALQIQGIAGLDFVLEADTDRDGNTRMHAVFLEANARPALLSAAREIIADIASEEQELAGSAPLMANPGFFELVSARAADLPAPRPDVARIAATRPAGQARSVAEQLDELAGWAIGLGFDPERRVAVGIAGGRLRRLMMHPDMGRFFGPALQEPIGAADAAGREQIAVLVQATDDNKIYVDSENPEFHESRNWIAADAAIMYPGADVTTWSDYERFGCEMTRDILKTLGYPPDRVADSMRRTVALVANAIASLRTLRNGLEGERVQQALGRGHFGGLRVCINGDIPRGGFSSSSAVTVAVLNAINAFYGLGLPDDTIVDVACQAEYGTGVKAGSLDQTAIQKGRAGESLLISSNPRERYRTLASFDVSDRKCGVLFPFSVTRDKEAVPWSNGMYASQLSPGGRLTSGAVRKMTGKAAEIAALLLKLPLDHDLFEEIEEDLVSDGVLTAANLRRVYGYLRQLPVRIPFAELRAQVWANGDWYAQQLQEHKGLGGAEAEAEADRTLHTLFDDWQEPVLVRTDESGAVATEEGVPLRAMVAYLYCEEAKNLYLLTHPEASWLEYISRSQLGDRCFDIDPNALPDRAEMMRPLEWETGLAGPALMEEWLLRFGATPFNFNKGLDDASLDRAASQNTQLHLMEGSSFFRGLALIDLIEAMLKRAFGDNAVAVRVNAAGQGDYFQVHFDVSKVVASDIKRFMDRAVYQRFGLEAECKFVDVYPGGPAVGVRLGRLSEMGAVTAGIRREAGIVPRRLAEDSDIG